jgi:hypothetical protein
LQPKLNNTVYKFIKQKIMKAHCDIIVDLTKGQEEFWRQIDEIDAILKPKKGLWSRIKAWFKR